MKHKKIEMIEHVAEVAQANDNDWKGANVLILCDPHKANLAQVLRDELINRGASVQTAAFAQAQTDNPEFTHFIAVLPQVKFRNESLTGCLRETVNRLRTLANPPRHTTIAYIQFGETGNFSRATAFAAGVHHERTDLKVRVIQCPPNVEPDLIAEHVIDELATPEAYAVVGYDSSLKRHVPRPRLLELSAHRSRGIPWSDDDVVLVTGGAKGITAECALAFAQAKGVRMALVGSSPLSAEIQDTLERFNAEGLTAQYYQCDITDIDAVSTLIQRIQQEVGPITGVIHGAARNNPQGVAQVSTEEAYAEIAPKVLGAMNLCQALALTPPKLFVGFSSIIGITGMPGNAWYGFSNEALDPILRRFEAEHPQTAVLSMAFSVWESVGMGARMGSLRNLAKMGIGAIPTDEGVRRFLELMENDPGERQVIVTARLGGLDTWHREQPVLPKAKRFLEQIVNLEPGVEVIARAHLNLEKDTYLRDHIYKGSHLFPTVTGLEAMAQVVAYAIGEREFRGALRIENICLNEAIVVNPEKGVDIEIQAEVLERETEDAVQRVRAGIRTEQTGFARDHFAATFVLGIDGEAPKEQVDMPEVPLDIHPKQELYGRLLFQGPRFQRIQQIFAIECDSNGAGKCIFQTETCPTEAVDDSETSEPRLLGDLFFRDSLLQSVQLIIPQDICLPVHIESIDIYHPNSDFSGTRIGVAILHRRNGEYYESQVYAIDREGRVVEQLNGYKLKILEHIEDNPTALELVDPSHRDEQKLRMELKTRAKSFDITTPAVSLTYLPGLHVLSKEERHERELPIFRRTVGQFFNDEEMPEDVQVTWLEGGKPVLAGVPKELQVSLSHDEQACICVAGRGPQGCDLAPLTRRTRQEWTDLLCRDRETLMQQLLDGGDSLDRAGTRIWAAMEADYKATNVKTVNLEIHQQEGDTVLFRGTHSDSPLYLLTFPRTFTRGPEKIIALVVQKESSEGENPRFGRKETRKAQAVIRRQSAEHDLGAYRMTADGPQGQQVFVHRFPLTFKETANLNRSVYFSNYFLWMGKVRELAMSPVSEPLAEQFATGEWGMVTNYSQTRILSEARLNDAIEVRLWLAGVLGRKNSKLKLHYDWYRVLPDGDLERIAISELGTTWVQILDHGVVEPQPFPEYFQAFVNERLPQSEVKDESPPIADVQLGCELYRAPKGPVAGPLLWKQTFATTLEDANFVGNIYFSNYTVWQGRVRDRFFYDLMPDYYRGAGEQGELLCRRCRVEHLREAMPFDQIEVTMSVRAVHECGVSLFFDYFRLTLDGNRQKIAFGEHDAVWMTDEPGERARRVAFPQRVREALLRAASASGSSTA